jgi:ribA/ribD-fused uncharacterized protein
MRIIDSFQSEYAFLSNFWPSPVVFNSQEWPTVEHAFQASKTFDEGERELIRNAPTPREAKELGRKVLNLRPAWEEQKADIMLELLRLKFSQNKALRDRLLATGNAVLIEGNTRHDNTWGDCRCDRCRDIHGENLLGRLLMRVRKELRNAHTIPSR